MALPRSARPLATHLKCERTSTSLLRPFSSSAPTPAEVETTTQTTPPKRLLDPERVSTPRTERRLLRLQNQHPIGSRRRRAAISTTTNIPFTQLPYQCFQEARKFLAEDREAKLAEIRLQQARIEALRSKILPDEVEAAKRDKKLQDMRHRLERAKIWADINDPLVKKRFEDGMGDMSKPIYRYLADKKWRSYARMLLMQRVEQMSIVPDLLPGIDPILSTQLSFPLAKTPWKRVKVVHGEKVLSTISEMPPVLQIQPYAKGEKLYTIAVMNPDVPNVARDDFDYRCHFLAVNVPVSPEGAKVKFAELDPETQVLHPWLPSFSQKGAPYQRMSIFVLEQPPAESVAPGSGDVAGSKALSLENVRKAGEGKYCEREGFTLRNLVSTFKLNPVGVDLFRTEWDEGTAGVMKRAGIVGWDVEFKRKKVEPLPYKRLKEERFR